MTRRLAAVPCAAIFACFLVLPAVGEELVTPPDRDVTAPGMMPGNDAEGPLVRVPVPPPPPDPPRWRRYFLPETSDAGTFHTSDGLTIRVAGVDPLAAEATCPLVDGSSWPCGRTALFSLRRFLHGRAVECFMAPPGAVRDLTAECRVGHTDLGKWLISSGWARAGGFPSDATLDLQREAQCAGRGIWRGSNRPDDCPPVQDNTAAN